MKEMATVTVCHKDTVDIQKHTKMADILISACGQAEMIKKELDKCELLCSNCHRILHRDDSV